MRDKHITELVLDSRRIDIRQGEPSLLVEVPAEWHPTHTWHDIVHIEVDKRPVLFQLITRWTARLADLPPTGAVISLFWVNPANRSGPVIKYLRDTETDEEFNARLHSGSLPALPGGSNSQRATYPSPTIVYGLQAPSQPYRKPSQ